MPSLRPSIASGAPRFRHPPAPEATALELDPLRVGPAQRDLAVRHDPLALRGRRARRDRELHRRLLTRGAVFERGAGRHRRRRGAIFFATTDLYGLPASVLSDNGAIYTATYRGATRAWRSNWPPRHPLQARQALPSPDPRQSRALPPDAEEVAAQTAAGGHDRRVAGPDRRLRAYLQRAASPPGQGLSADARVARTRQGHPETDGQPLLAKTRVRHDHVDRWGSVTLRYRAKLHHIGVGRPNAASESSSSWPTWTCASSTKTAIYSATSSWIRRLTTRPIARYGLRVRLSQKLCNITLVSEARPAQSPTGESPHREGPKTAYLI